jgi:hypothetical protein
LSDSALRRALAEQAAAVERYLEALSDLSHTDWGRPRGEGKWSPAQITEHLALAYDVLAGELRGGAAMAQRLRPWRRRLLRWFLLPHILFHRSFPLRAPAPRELRPERALASREEGGERLRRAAASFEDALRAPQRAGQLTHAYFGEVSVVRAVRFVAIHLDHHRRQVEQAAAPGPKG